MSQLGGQTFAVQRWPAVFFGGPEGREKYWRRKDITLPRTRRWQEKATLAAQRGHGTQFLGWPGRDALSENPAQRAVAGRDSGKFSRPQLGRRRRPRLDGVRCGQRPRRLRVGQRAGENRFPFGSPVGERLKINGINYSVVGVLDAQGRLARRRTGQFRRRARSPPR